MRLAFSIAFRFLKSNKGQTALILIGIVIGVAVQIFIGSLIDGLQISLVDKTIGNASQITILPSGKDKYFAEDKALLDTIVNSKPKRVVYVSCNPATLARDLRILVDSGLYELVKVQPVDMFGQTSHVETVVLITRVDK